MISESVRLVFGLCGDAVTFARKGNVTASVQCLQYSRKLAETAIKMQNERGHCLDYGACLDEVAVTARVCRRILLYPESLHSQSLPALDIQQDQPYTLDLKARFGATSGLAWD